MKKVSCIAAVVFSLSGCLAPPIHMYGTETIDPNQLASISGKDNEVEILEIDDKKFTAGRSDYVYLIPGIHKIKAKLTWSDFVPLGSTFITTSIRSPYLRTRCLNVEAGKSYGLAAIDPGNNWKLMVWKDSKKVELEKCPEDK